MVAFLGNMQEVYVKIAYDKKCDMLVMNYVAHKTIVSIQISKSFLHFDHTPEVKDDKKRCAVLCHQVLSLLSVTQKRKG